MTTPTYLVYIYKASVGVNLTFLKGKVTKRNYDETHVSTTVFRVFRVKK